MSEFIIPVLHQLPILDEPLVVEGEIVASPSLENHSETAAGSQQMPTERMLAEIEELKQLAYEKAYAEGLLNGKSDGVKQVSLEMQKSLELLREAEQDFKSQYKQHLAGMEAVISSIVFEAVLKIVGSEIKSASNRAEIISQVIAQYDHHHIVQILVNPSDIKAIEETLHTADISDGLEGLLYPDSTVSIAGSRIVFKDSIINTDIKKQLHAFAEHLIEHAPVK